MYKISFVLVVIVLVVDDDDDDDVVPVVYAKIYKWVLLTV